MRGFVSLPVCRLLQLLGDWQDYGSIIIFVNKQIEADELFAELLKVSPGPNAPYSLRSFVSFIAPHPIILSGGALLPVQRLQFCICVHSFWDCMQVITLKNFAPFALFTLPSPHLCSC